MIENDINTDNPSDDCLRFRKCIAPRGKEESLRDYNFRLITYHRIYKRLEHVFQIFVEAAAEDGYYYRGETNYKLFRDGYEEFISYQGKSEDERAKYIAKIKRAIYKGENND